ncbi:MAG: hypothetical protein ACM3ML_27455 [Micromonosporaceae bacterium]
MLVGMLAWALLACGGAPPGPPPGTPAVQPPPPGQAPAPAARNTSTAAAAAPQARDTAAPDSSARTGLVREVFGYRGGGRDPFRSLLASGAVRPLIGDLRLMAVVYDPRYPARSVAVLRDVSVNKRYDVRVDDELGRMRVVEIRPQEVVLSIEEFGVEQQQTLTLKKQEGVP